MEQKNISQQLLERKIQDYRINAGLMPNKVRILSKLFAKSLGMNAGKLALSYDVMFSEIENGNNLETVQKTLRKDVGKRSKVMIKIPLRKAFPARICGFVAMNYAGYFDNEALLYTNLIEDLNTQTLAPEYLAERIRLVGAQNSDKYYEIIANKEQSIYDFGLLMGFSNDDARFSDLTSQMPTGIADYFTKIAKVHKGGLFRMSYPLPLKKFKGAISEGLYKDTTTFNLQEGVQGNYKFSLPEKQLYQAILDEVKSTTKDITAKDLSLIQRWKLASALPATAFYLAGINAFAHDANEHEHVDNVLGAAVTAATTAASTADDGSDFVTTWYTSFTTLL